MTPELASGLIRFLLSLFGSAFLQKHIDEWEAARLATDAEADQKFGPKT